MINSQEPRKKRLSDLEEMVMSVLWQGAATADEVRTHLVSKHPMKDSTVRTVLRRLEEKGYLTHAVDGRTYLYRAVDPQHSVAAQAVEQIVDRLCDGSLEQLLVGMVDSGVVDSRELERLAQRIAAARKTKEKEDDDRDA